MSITADRVSSGDPKAEWLHRVLGFVLPGEQPPPTPGFEAEFQAANAAWVDAVAMVDRQMAALKNALFATGDSDYEDIAEHSLDHVIGDGPQKLSVALRQVGDGGDAKLHAGAAKLLPELTRLLKDIQASEAVAVCEANPLRVPVFIRATLGGAITRLQAVLGQVAGG